MGKVISKMTRPIKNINIENRAQKVLRKRAENPSNAPRHPSTIESYEKMAVEHPEYLNAQKEKYGSLIDNMKKLQLNSIGAPPEIRSKQRTLPELRSKSAEEEYGFPEPEHIPVGKTSMRAAMQFISQHYTAPMNCTVADIAKEYKLDAATVQQVIKHFHTLQMHMPADMMDKYPHLLDDLDTQKTSPEQPKLSKS